MTPMGVKERPGAASAERNDSTLPLPWAPRNLRRLGEVSKWRRRSARTQTSDLLAEQEALYQRAAASEGSWARWARLRRELDIVKRLLLKSPKCRPEWRTGGDMANFTQVAVRRWAVISLAVRAPTTVISELRSMISMALGGKNKEDIRTRRLRVGIQALYGTQAWYTRPPDLQPHQVAAMVSNPAAPLWFRVRLDIEYQAMARDADMTYIRFPDDVTVDEEENEVVISFPFLKNDMSGTFGVIKHVRPLAWNAFKEYTAQLTNVGSDALFPQTYDDFLKEIKKYVKVPGVGTRAIRRGAAVAAAEVVGPAVIQTMLGHKSVGTQRTYLRKVTAQCRQQQRVVQRALRPPGSVGGTAQSEPAGQGCSMEQGLPGGSLASVGRPTDSQRGVSRALATGRAGRGRGTPQRSLPSWAAPLPTTTTPHHRTLPRTTSSTGATSRLGTPVTLAQALMSRAETIGRASGMPPEWIRAMEAARPTRLQELEGDSDTDDATGGS